jgi:hypothetical protein
MAIGIRHFHCRYEQSVPDVRPKTICDTSPTVEIYIFERGTTKGTRRDLLLGMQQWAARVGYETKLIHDRAVQAGRSNCN